MSIHKDRARAVLIGAGGHAKAVLEMVRAGDEYEVVGALAPGGSGGNVLGVPVLGGDDLLPALFSEGVRCAFLGIGSVGDASLRRRLAATLESLGFSLPTIVHPRAYVSPSASLGAGAQVLPLAVVHVAVAIGNHAIVNTGAIVEHDAMVGPFAHLAPGACLAGNVQVGEGAHVGIGASVREGIVIGPGAIVGAGAAVVRDVSEGATVVGVPACILER